MLRDLTLGIFDLKNTGFGRRLPANNDTLSETTIQTSEEGENKNGQGLEDNLCLGNISLILPMDWIFKKEKKKGFFDVDLRRSP